MIQELSIQNFAIIEKTKIDFSQGMTVLTGETGAGKSIIIDAISQLLGQRAKPSMVKEGQDKAYIEAVLDYNQNPEIDALLEEFHIDQEDLLYVSKEILASGKSICKINSKSVPMAVLKQILPKLIDIHSQFDNHSLLDEKNYLEVLDNFCKEEIHEQQTLYQKHYQLFMQYQRELAQLKKQEDFLEQVDFYKSQLNEINQFDFENESIEELEKQRDSMKQFQKLKENMQPFKHYMLDDQGALPQFYTALNYLDEIKEQAGFESFYNDLYDFYYKLDEMIQDILDTYHQVDFDDYRFEEVQEKLAVVQRLKRKYGPGIDSILDKKKEIEEHIYELEHFEEKIASYHKQIEQEKSICLDLAKQIHEVRVQKAIELSKKITNELHLLYMEHAQFEIKVTYGDLHQRGMDLVEFLITTNVGHTKQSVAHIASGGELSRIMLALKTVLLEKSSLETIIFDEVDTGVSGKVAYAIGQKMQRIAKSKQVLCITHLPQVAAFASHHLYVSKYIENKDTKTRVSLLNENQRIEEIAKMLSGDLVSEQALQQAQNLIEQVNNS